MPAHDDRLDTLVEVIGLVNSSLDLDEIQIQSMEAAKRLAGAEGASLLLLDESKGELYFDKAAGERGEEVKQVRLKKGEGIAGWVAEHNQPLVVDDVNADPRFTGRVDRKSGFVTRNILCVPVCIKGRLIGVLQAINKAEGDFTGDDQSYLVALANQVAVAIENARLYQDLRSAFYSTVQTLAEVADMRDSHARGHAQRVAQYSVATARVLGVPPEQFGTLKLAALLHDVGMLGVSDEAVRRSDASHPEQRALIARHIEYGEQILAKIKPLAESLPAIRHHHEHFDGSGLPQGLKGAEIPPFARIIAVADTFDALTHQRPYARRVGRDEALDALREMAGRELDPKVVEAFVQAYLTYDLEQLG